MDSHLDPAVSLVDVSLDAAQRRVVELPRGRAALVLGEAGHGKTTVAIHRLARLAKEDPALRAVVVVPGEGLRRLIERALVRLGVDAPVVTFDRFARAQARRAFPDLPRRESVDATAATIRLKRDPALRVAVDAIAARDATVIDDDPEGLPTARAALQHLFGDRTLLERVVAASEGRVPAHAIDETLDHTRVQFGLTSEEAWAHVDDRARLVPVDRRALDDGTPDADAGALDSEDYAVLFAIDRARAKRTGARPAAPRRWDCLVIDEAQELAPIELALLGRSVKTRGTLVVAGDADQLLDPAVTFEGWDATMRRLRRADHERVVLDVGYRSAPQVAALARSIRAGSGPAPGEVASFDDEASLATRLAADLAAATEANARATIAVIARSPLFARRLAARLRAHLPVRLVLDGAFSFAPGVDVTTVDQVRGLEVDRVVVPDASRATYPDDPASRRALYVAVTRARADVTLLAPGAPSPIVAHGRS
jgi:RecA/RadA recombinase